MAIKTAREAMAQHLGWEYSELKEYRYHAGRTSCPVYTTGNLYYCATKGNKKPARYISRGIDQTTQWTWEEVKEPYINGFGFKIWQSKSE